MNDSLSHVWTIAEFGDALRASLAKRRSHDLRLLKVVALLALCLASIIWLKPSLSRDHLSAALTTWIVAVCVLLLYILLRARRAQERGALRCPACARALDDLPEAYEDLLIDDSGFHEIRCPSCDAIIARRAA